MIHARDARDARDARYNGSTRAAPPLRGFAKLVWRGAQRVAVTIVMLVMSVVWRGAQRAQCKDPSFPDLL